MVGPRCFPEVRSEPYIITGISEGIHAGVEVWPLATVVTHLLHFGKEGVFVS